MEMGNWTLVTEFILLGLTSNPDVKILLFLVFLLVYIITLLGNIGMIALVQMSPALQLPMYFFLSNLSFSDLCYSTIIMPNLLATFLEKSVTVPFSACVIQLYFFAIFASTEGFLLAVMAYDRYVAICNPLLYAVLLKPRACYQMVAAVYVGGLVIAAVHTGSTFVVSYCGPNVIDHFYCDIPPLLKLSCTDTFISKTVSFIVVVSLGMFCLLITLMSYVYILSTILKIRSAGGRRKAFSTCASHLGVVSLFYVTVLFMYLRPASGYSENQDKVASVFYTVMIPMLNPMIYSLRNKEVKKALEKIMGRK